MMENNNYTYKRCATFGCESRNAEGLVVAWSIDELTAAMIVTALNEKDEG
jgi:hypothetical protein